VKIVAGLGNPGAKYVGTPHNAGFEVLDWLARDLGCDYRSAGRFKALTAEALIGGEKVLLVKPQTFMNLSGESVGALMNFYKVPADDLIVVYDDVNLDVGRIRIRPKGGSGGHNGLTSVIRHAGTEDFTRIRVGVGRGRSAGDLVSHVLRRFAPDDRERMEGAIERAGKAVYTVLESGTETAMNRFNSAVQEQSEEKA